MSDKPFLATVGIGNPTTGEGVEVRSAGILRELLDANYEYVSGNGVRDLFQQKLLAQLISDLNGAQRMVDRLTSKLEKVERERDELAVFAEEIASEISVLVIGAMDKCPLCGAEVYAVLGAPGHLKADHKSHCRYLLCQTFLRRRASQSQEEER